MACPQYYDFQIIETDHFDVYYYEEEREAAIDAARMAERIYGRLSRILDHDFRTRKPIILYASQSDFQQTNVLGGHISESTGGVTESLKDRVLLPLTGSYEEFHHVLAHAFDIAERLPPRGQPQFHGDLPRPGPLDDHHRRLPAVDGHAAQ